jgi:hypothetical protein
VEWEDEGDAWLQVGEYQLRENKISYNIERLRKNREAGELISNLYQDWSYRIFIEVVRNAAYAAPSTPLPTLQLQRMAFEEAGFAELEGGANEVPTTIVKNQQIQVSKLVIPKPRGYFYLSQFPFNIPPS